MNLRNSVQLIGNLGNDPEVKHLENDKVLAKLSIATSETYKKASGEKVTETQWHNITVWGASAKFAENFLKKGHEIALEGKLIYRSFEDNAGVKRYITEIVANELLLINSRDNKKD